MLLELGMISLLEKEHIPSEEMVRPTALDRGAEAGWEGTGQCHKVAWARREAEEARP